MKFENSPCYKDGKDCSKRHSACHQNCEEFEKWRAKLDADHKAKRKDTDNEYNLYVIPRIIERKIRKNEKEKHSIKRRGGSD